MPNTPFRRKLVLLLLGSALAFPWAAVASPQADSPPRREANAAAVSDLLGSLWGLFLSAWDDRGCDIDPNSACTSGPAADPAPTLESDRGCHIDPSGACHP